jgi:glycosyltransferase involved in cell wall biosynthesis
MNMDDFLLPDTRGVRQRNCIAIVSHAHPSISKGGAEISAYAVYQGLLALGHDAIFIAAVPESLATRVELGSRREYAISVDPADYDYFYHIGSSTVCDQLIDIIERNSVKIVNFHHFMNFGTNSLRAVAERPGIRTVLTLHEFVAICHHHGQMITRPALNLCEKSSTASCASCFPENSGQQFAMRRRHFLNSFAALDGFVSPSKFLAQRFIEWGAPAERMQVVENGLAHVPPIAPPRRKRVGDEQWVFGYFGQINPFKGLSTILDAADLIAEYEDLPETLKIRIHGNMVGQSQEFIDRFEACVAKHSFLTYAGAYDNSVVSRLMSDCDYMIIPSSWWENSPVVIQEAYAVGRPIICTGIGGMAEKVIDGVTGLHFNLRDHVDLVRVIEIAATQQMNAKLRTGLPKVPDSTEMAQKYLEIFEMLPPAEKPIPEPDEPEVKAFESDNLPREVTDAAEDIVQGSDSGQNVNNGGFAEDESAAELVLAEDVPREAGVIAPKRARGRSARRR